MEFTWSVASFSLNVDAKELDNQKKEHIHKTHISRKDEKGLLGNFITMFPIVQKRKMQSHFISDLRRVLDNEVDALEGKVTYLVRFKSTDLNRISQTPISQLDSDSANARLTNSETQSKSLRCRT